MWKTTTTTGSAGGRRRLQCGGARPKLTVRVAEEVRTIGGWPTDTVTIDWVEDGGDEANEEDSEAEATRCQKNEPATPSTTTTRTRTLLLFVPGNPGCVGWYVPMLRAIVEELGPGFSAAGTSYAGHGVGDAKTVPPSSDEGSSTSMDAIDAHSVDGQVDHKAEWVDVVLRSYDRLLHKNDSRDDGVDAPPRTRTRVVFVTHSIGAHLVQRLCVLRPDVLSRTVALIHLMPFLRFAPSLERHRLPLELVAHGVPNLAVAFLETASRLASVLPEGWLDSALVDSVKDEGGRRLAVGLVRQPAMARNFLRLGIDELRSLPVARHDDSAMRVIGESCPTAMLYCGGPDMWAPREHVDDVLEMKRLGVVPSNVTIEYFDELLHDFVVRGPRMVRSVVDFCVRTIEGVTEVDGDGGAADCGGGSPDRSRGRSLPPGGNLVSRL